MKEGFKLHLFLSQKTKSQRQIYSEDISALVQVCEDLGPVHFDKSSKDDILRRIEKQVKGED